MRFDCLLLQISNLIFRSFWGYCNVLCCVLHWVQFIWPRMRCLRKLLLRNFVLNPLLHYKVQGNIVFYVMLLFLVLWRLEERRIEKLKRDKNLKLGWGLQVKLMRRKVKMRDSKEKVLKLQFFNEFMEC